MNSTTTTRITPISSDGLIVSNKSASNNALSMRRNLRWLEERNLDGVGADDSGHNNCSSGGKAFAVGNSLEFHQLVLQLHLDLARACILARDRHIHRADLVDCALDAQVALEVEPRQR